MSEAHQKKQFSDEVRWQTDLHFDSYGREVQQKRDAAATQQYNLMQSRTVGEAHRQELADWKAPAPSHLSSEDLEAIWQRTLNIEKERRKYLSQNADFLKDQNRTQKHVASEQKKADDEAARAKHTRLQQQADFEK